MIGVVGLVSVGAIVVPGSITRTTGPRYAVVEGAGTVDGVTDVDVSPGAGTPGGAATVVVGADGVVDSTVGVDGIVVVVGTTVTTAPVAERGKRPETSSAVQSSPGRYKRIGLRVGAGGASQSMGCPSKSPAI